MPHTTVLAMEVNWFAALVAVFSAASWLVMWHAQRRAYALLLAWGWIGLCAYFSLIAISAGPAPVFARADIALAVRLILVASMALLGGGKLLLVRGWCLTRRAVAGSLT